MFKRSLLLGIVSGILAGVASVVYAKVYNDAIGTDFSAVITPLKIMLACIAAGLLAGLIHYGLMKAIQHRATLVFNLLFTVASFATIVLPFAKKLPLDIEFPELFPGLVVPMHFFPVLGWLTLYPLFFRDRKSVV